MTSNLAWEMYLFMLKWNKHLKLNTDILKISIAERKEANLDDMILTWYFPSVQHF